MQYCLYNEVTKLHFDLTKDMGFHKFTTLIWQKAPNDVIWQCCVAQHNMFIMIFIKKKSW